MTRICRRTGCSVTFVSIPHGPGRRKLYCSQRCRDTASPSARSISVRPDTRDAISAICEANGITIDELVASWLDEAGAP